MWAREQRTSPGRRTAASAAAARSRRSQVLQQVGDPSVRRGLSPGRHAGVLLRQGQRAQLHLMVSRPGHLRSPALRDGRPGAPQEREARHPLAAGGGTQGSQVRHGCASAGADGGGH